MRRISVTFGFTAAVCLAAWVQWRLSLLFLLSLLVHEAGHLAVMYLMGVPVYQIRLCTAGAVISGGFCSYRQELCCAAAGPLISFLTALLCSRCLPELAIVSGGLGIFNLLPVFPLDGGRILRAALLLYLKQETVDVILRHTTTLVCCVLMILACWVTAALQAGLWPIFAVLIILWRVGTANWQER